MDLTSVAERLRNFRNQYMEPPNPEPEVAAPPPRGHDLQIQGRDLLQEKIDTFMQNVPQIGNISPDHQDLPDLTAGMAASTTDFPDDKFIDNKAILLFRMSDEDVAAIGRLVIPMLSSGFSQQGIGALFVLAYHLRDPGNTNEFVFPEEMGVANMHDVPYEDLSATVVTTAHIHEPLSALASAREEAQAYAYIAASTLRLFTKSEENYILATNHIRIGYARFYGTPIPINNPNPSDDALKGLTHYFSNGAIFKSTLYRLLYLAGSTNVAVGMRKFLYDIHLANTGIHIVNIFVRLCGALNCPPGILITTFNSPEFKRQVDALVAMLKLIMNEDANHTRKMWRYGRLFDETFMSPLQTKTCPTLTYILAAALKEEASSTNKDILNIRQLADVSAEKKRTCVAAGKMITRMIRAHHARSGSLDGRQWMNGYEGRRNEFVGRNTRQGRLLKATRKWL